MDGPPSSDDRPIVVGGCYRSGTSLVRRLLDAHPRIHCGPEVKFFRDFYADYLDVDDPIEHLRFMVTARSLLPEPELLEVLGRAFVEIHERAAERAGKARWADKVPENLVFLDQWQQLLGEEWLLLHVIRNPLDTLASIEEWRFPKSVPVELDARIDLYLRYAKAGLDFRDRHPDRYVGVLYEDLVARPERTMREAMSGLGEELDPRQLDLGTAPAQTGLEDPKVGESPSIHGDSVDRWRTVLSDEDAARIGDATAETWSRLSESRPV